MRSFLPTIHKAALHYRYKLSCFNKIRSSTKYVYGKLPCLKYSITTLFLDKNEIQKENLQRLSRILTQTLK